MELGTENFQKMAPKSSSPLPELQPNALEKIGSFMKVDEGCYEMSIDGMSKEQAEAVLEPIFDRLKGTRHALTEEFKAAIWSGNVVHADIGIDLRIDEDVAKVILRVSPEVDNGSDSESVRYFAHKIEKALISSMN